MNLKGKTAVVTGGGSGFGRGIAAELVRRGAKVIVTGRNAAKLEGAAAEIGCLPVVADVTCAADWDRVFESAGEVDILVNNAGAGVKIAPLAEQSDVDIVTSIATNLTGAILGSKRAAKVMSGRRSGCIVNISSVCALHAWPGWSVYTAAKAGLSKFSHALHCEMRPRGVRVFNVTPSWGQTDFNMNCGISGASEDGALAAKCIAPAEIGRLVCDLIETPDHLAVPDVTLQPMIQDISPM